MKKMPSSPDVKPNPGSVLCTRSSFGRQFVVSVDGVRVGWWFTVCACANTHTGHTTHVALLDLGSSTHRVVCVWMVEREMI